jgi:hypothetical protein
MKQLLMAAAAAVCIAGCASDDYQGRPGEESYVETENDRRVENKASDNLRDIGRQSSPTAPFTRGNGSMNF